MNDRGRVADDSAANGARDSIGGENDAALTAAAILARRNGGHGRRVTPDGAGTGAPLAGRAAGVFAARVRSRATTRSVMSRFLSADTINDACWSLFRIIAYPSSARI